MTPSDDDEFDDIDDIDETSRAESVTSRFRQIYWPPGPFMRTAAPEEAEIVPPEKRKAAMVSLDARETKLSFVALAVATLFGIALPIYFIVDHVITKAGKHRVTVAPDALLLGGAAVVFCLIGYLALWKQRRTLVAFMLMLSGFALAIPQLLVGLLYIMLGGWLMLNAWRMNRYGTTNAKLIRKEVASRPRGKAAASASRSSSSTSKGKASSQPGARKPPTASKRYTPKAPPRKKIPKPTQ
jgi:hypothetical protein